MSQNTELLEALDIPVYTTDADGKITFYNAAAAEFWGHRPEIGSDAWCGSWRLFWPDGRPLPHDQCPMAITLREGREVLGMEAVAETPDGRRRPFVPYPRLLKDRSGNVVGAINLLVDIADRQKSEIELARLASIVTSSDDAIISKTLEGIITTWNVGAERIFGYTTDEMIGRSIKHIIPLDLHSEEDEILARIRRGEHIDHYETIRVTKDARRLDISLTVSPLRDRSGQVVGASKIGRDITERKRSEELQRLLLGELNHRVKNTLAMVQAIANQSLVRATSPADFVKSFNGRLQALARAHDLLVRQEMKGADIAEIVREQVVLGDEVSSRISTAGPLLLLDSRAAVQLALVLHELATNARKYGALSVPTGRLDLKWDIQTFGERKLYMHWIETGVPNLRAPTTTGFGSTLIERTLAGHGGEAPIRYGPDGIVCEIVLPLPVSNEQHLLRQTKEEDAFPGRGALPRRNMTLQGTRILLVEDEALVAMEIEALLAEMGCKVVGPASTIERAKRLIAEGEFDAALLDANLGGQPVHELAAALAQGGKRFAFATGYGRDNLPPAFQDAVILTKPFGSKHLAAVLAEILGPHPSPGVISIRRRP